MSDPVLRPVRVWDLPTRLFHWLLVACVAAMFITAWSGAVDWHARFGYAVGALVAFRLAWGFAGGHWSRFSSFPVSVSAAWRHFRSPVRSVGHNPMGAFSIYAMLAILLLQVATGLFTATKEDFAGPLTPLVSNAKVHLATGYHKRIGQWIVLGLAALHVIAIAWHLLKGRNLVRAMLTGDAPAPAGTPPSRDDVSTRLLALSLALASALAMWGIVSLGG